jgi:hypothetical protein
MAISFTSQEIELGRAMGLRNVNSQNDLAQIRAFARDNGVNSLDSQNDLKILLPRLQVPAPAEAPAQAPAPAPTPAPAPAQSPTDLLTGLLMQWKSDSTMAAEEQTRQQKEQARWQDEVRQGQRFDQYQAAMQASMAAMQSSYDMQLRAATATLPPPERSAVAPKLGDARTPTGRNAAANTLSQLRIISPSLLGSGLESITLGGI